MALGGPGQFSSATSLWCLVLLQGVTPGVSCCMAVLRLSRGGARGEYSRDTSSRGVLGLPTGSRGTGVLEPGPAPSATLPRRRGTRLRRLHSNAAAVLLLCLGRAPATSACVVL
uniref:Uncharacterized protein n=1 Tax=Ixodes ricinus TaxID=34613 RepID=A0A6B0UKU4_IXORI